MLALCGTDPLSDWLHVSSPAAAPIVAPRAQCVWARATSEEWGCDSRRGDRSGRRNHCLKEGDACRSHIDKDSLCNLSPMRTNVQCESMKNEYERKKRNTSVDWEKERVRGRSNFGVRVEHQREMRWLQQLPRMLAWVRTCAIEIPFLYYTRKRLRESADCMTLVLLISFS